MLSATYTYWFRCISVIFSTSKVHRVFKIPALGTETSHFGLLVVVTLTQITTASQVC